MIQKESRDSRILYLLISCMRSPFHKLLCVNT